MERQNISQTNWAKVKGEIQKTWSGLDSSELERTRGDVRQISELVQKKYGLRREDVEKRLDEVIGGRTEHGVSQGSSMSGNRPSSSSSSTSSSAERSERNGGSRQEPSRNSSSSSNKDELPRHRDMGSSSSASSRGDWEEGSPRQDFSRDRHEDRDSYKQDRDRSSRDSGSGRTFSGQRDESGRSGFNPQVNRNDQSRKNSDSSEKRH